MEGAPLKREEDFPILKWKREEGRGGRLLSLTCVLPRRPVAHKNVSEPFFFCLREERGTEFSALCSQGPSLIRGHTKKRVPPLSTQKQAFLACLGIFPARRLRCKIEEEGGKEGKRKRKTCELAPSTIKKREGMHGTACKQASRFSHQNERKRGEGGEKNSHCFTGK